MRVLIIPDKFKGTLTASEAAEAIARGWQNSRPQDTLDLLPMSDGGDGFGEMTSAVVQGRVQRTKTVDAAHRRCLGKWWWSSQKRTAIIESAAVIGLAMLPPGRFQPFDLDTYGLGVVVRAAAKRGATRCLFGIGGSATNDGGFGLARALDWQFLDDSGQPLQRWTQLHRLRRIVPPRRRRWFTRCTVATDVQNPLLGPRGASRVYGPQKGLLAQHLAVAERCLAQLAKVTRQQLGRDCARLPGTGAAGGLGFGLLAFLGAEIQPGFEVFAQQAALETHLRRADLVITGEGAIDRSTLMGKGVGQIALQCRRRKIPCLGLGGIVSPEQRSSHIFTAAYGLTDLTSAKRAQAGAADWLERLARKVALAPLSLSRKRP